MHPQKPPMDRRPPLVLSPRRLRPRHVPPRPAPPASTRTPPASTAKARLPAFRASVAVESPARLPEYQMMVSSELAALAKMAKEEFGIASAAAASASPAAVAPKSPLFERGRFYELYSARRNERLKRKMWGEESAEEALTQDPGVAVELSKKRSAKKTTAAAGEGSLRKSLPAHFSVDRGSALRSSLRSAKEMKKPSAASGADGAAATAGRRVVTRSSLRRI